MNAMIAIAAPPLMSRQFRRTSSPLLIERRAPGGLRPLFVRAGPCQSAALSPVKTGPSFALAIRYGLERLEVMAMRITATGPKTGRSGRTPA
jgi:hypothetical protein